MAEKVAITSVKELREELKKLKDTMVSAEQGSKAYNDALTRTANIQHQLKDQMVEINATAMDFGQIVGNCTKAIGGMVGGFQAVTAAMNLFGIENEDVLKSMQKMQQMMALTQALPAIDNGIKAFRRLGIVIKSTTTALKGLSAAAISTGLGAILAAVALLAANWDKVKVALGGVNEEEEKQKKIAIDNYLKNVNTELEKQFNLEKELIKIRGGNDLNVAAALVNTYKSKIAEATAELENLRKEQEELINLGSLDPYDLKRISQLASEYKKVEAEVNNYTEELQKATEEYEKQKILQEARDKAAKDAQDRELEIANDSAKHLFEPESLVEQLNAYFADKVIKVPVNIEIEEDEDTSFEDEYREKVTSTIESLRSVLITDEQQFQDEMNQLDVAFKTGQLENEEEYLRMRELLIREYSQKEIQIQQDKISAYASISSNIASILGSVADAMDENNKEEFEAAKAFQISAAVIQTLSGAIGAYTGAASNPGLNAIPVVGPALAQALGITSAAAVAASGAAQIAQISKRQYKDKSSSISKPSASAMTTINAPVQYTQDVQGANIESSIKDSRVYVVESDITNAQEKVSVAESEATF